MNSLYQQTSFFDEFLPGQLPGNSMNNQVWKTFFNTFYELGTDEIKNRRQDIIRFLKENGVTYNIYGDPSGINRTWNLDIIPFIIHHNEWQQIEQGLIQRAKLFNLILKDIYGEQRLIKDGILPLEVVYCHTGFLRECCGIDQSPNHHLVTYSADIARDTKGNFWILNDRTQAPSGSGYVLENRMAMARIVPELFNGLRVKRLSGFYNAMREAFIACARHTDNPRIVVLTPGPENETYFEHSFLASHLGFTLVQGEDLMVKDNYVWLKTLSGLEKVDVIVRRVDDIYCDPLELKEDSQLGVPGLLQVIREGNVSIANPLGSSVVENPGLIPFLPAIAKYFHFEPLKLPTVAAWWCGQAKELQYVLANLPFLIIKKIYREPFSHSSIDVSTLNSLEFNKLKNQIIAQPYLFVAQEKVVFSDTPSFESGKIQQSHALFRSFVVNDGKEYVVMEGGLTRTSLDKQNIIISNQSGSYSKDTWVISDDEPTLGFGYRREYDSIQYQLQSKNILPSRSAENLFWVGRYTERILANTRFQRTVMQFVEDANKAFYDDHQLLKQTLLSALTNFAHVYPGFTGKDAGRKISQPWDEFANMLFNSKLSGSLAYNMASFHRAMQSVRDYWSTDTWRVMRDMEENMHHAETQKYRGHYKLLSFVDGLITSLMAFVSLNSESISRGHGFKIMDIGRKIEHCLLLNALLQSLLVQKNEDSIQYLLKEAALTIDENLINYRFKYRTHLQLLLMLDLLLFDAENPRSLIYQVNKLKAHMADLPGGSTDLTMPLHMQYVNDLIALLTGADRVEIAMLSSNASKYQNLDDFLNQINGLLISISNVISKTYFKHIQSVQ